MINLLENPSILPSLPQNWVGTYVGSRVSAYGVGERFAPFYTDSVGTVVSVLDGNAVLAGDAADAAEWAAFLLQAEVSTLMAERSVAEKLAKYLQLPIYSQKVMQLRHFTGTNLPTTFAPSPREMYPVLSAVFTENLPPFDNWYVDVSHRLRHGVCHVAGIKKEEGTAAVAMTVAETAGGAVIGSVATLPTYRKKGFSSACIGNLITVLHAENPAKKIWILPKTDYAENLYKKLGFSVCGEAGKIVFKGR